MTRSANGRTVLQGEELEPAHLRRGEALIDPLAPFLGLISYLKCPISDMVVLNSDENEPRDRT
jgi:hypothetical protein